MQPLATRPAAPVRAARYACRWLFASLLGVAFAAALPACALEWRIDLSPAGEVFPALELSQSVATGDPADAAGNGLLRVRIVGDGTPRRVRLSVDTDGLLAPTVIDTEVTDTADLRPRLHWNVDALRALRVARRQDVRISLESPGARTLERTLAVRVHPLDEALYFVRDGDARIDLGWAFAAWVDPQDPVVDEVLALADQGETAGTLDDQRDSRLRQARAIWIALERRGLRYADDGAGISQGPVIYSQRVRLLSDTWNDRVANCLDGSVLIASALERLGIRSMLVLVPGHAFIGFYTEDSGRHAEFLETTLLGRGSGGRRGTAEDAQFSLEQASAGFDAARAAGQASYRRAASRLDGRHRPNYAIIDISTARTYGIMPLAVGWRASPPTVKRSAPMSGGAPLQRRSATP